MPFLNDDDEPLVCGHGAIMMAATDNRSFFGTRFSSTRGTTFSNFPDSRIKILPSMV